MGSLEHMIETPKLAVDVIIRVWGEVGLRGLVLIERQNDPHGLALPGGFVEIGETVEAAAVREMLEETGLHVELAGIFGVYSDPGRDPRFHCVSVVFVGDATGEPSAGSDAGEVIVFPFERIPLPLLVFDHRRIIEDFLRFPGRLSNSFG